MDNKLIMSWCDADKNTNRDFGDFVEQFSNDNGKVNGFGGVGRVGVVVGGGGDWNHNRHFTSTTLDDYDNDFSQEEQFHSSTGIHRHYRYYEEAPVQQILDSIRSSRQILFQGGQQDKEEGEDAIPQEMVPPPPLDSSDLLRILEPTPLGPNTTRTLVEKVSLIDATMSSWKSYGDDDLNLIATLMMASTDPLAVNQEKNEELSSPWLPLEVNPNKRHLAQLTQDEVVDRELATPIKRQKRHLQQQQLQQRSSQHDVSFQNLKDDTRDTQDYIYNDKDNKAAPLLEVFCQNNITMDDIVQSTTQEITAEAARTMMNSSSSSLSSSSSSTTATMACLSTERYQIRPFSSYDTWESHLEDLIDFKKKHGHCLVPHDYKDNIKLAQWTKRQRYQYKLKLSKQHSTLTDERQRALDELGFTWDLHKAAWLEKLECIKSYRYVHGHTNVPSHYGLDQPLAIWVKCQRRQYKLYRLGKQSSMTEERVRQLNALDFDWNPRNIV